MLLRAPFSVARPSFFHAALEVPPLEPARPLAGGTFLLRVRSTHARSNWDWDDQAGPRRTSFDGTYHEWAAFEAAWGVIERIELSGRAVLAGWDEHQDRFNLFYGADLPLVSDEYRKILGIGATARHDNMSVFGLKLKTLLLDADRAGLDLSLAASAKFPIGRDRDLTHSGTTDLALTLLGSVPFSWGALHVNLGGVLPFGEQSLFVDRARIELHPFMQGAAGVTVPVTDSLALGLQIEGNTSSFREVEVLEEGPITAVAGIRKILFDRLVLEVGGGTGFRWSSSYQWLIFASMAVEL